MGESYDLTVEYFEGLEICRNKLNKISNIFDFKSLFLIYITVEISFIFIVQSICAGVRLFDFICREVSHEDRMPNINFQITPIS